MRRLLTITLLIAVVFGLVVDCGAQDQPTLEYRVKALEDLTSKLTDRMSGQDGDMAWLSRTGVPVGAVLAFAGAWPPAGVDVNNKLWTEDSLGWILCDGRSIADAKYAALRAVLNKNAAPDFRGYFLRGYNAVPGGLDAGHQLGTPEQDDFKSHHHPASSTTTFSHTHALDPGGSWAIMNDAQGGGDNHVARQGYLGNISTTGVNSGSPTTTTTIGDSGGTETRPVNISVNYIIRFKATQ